MDLWILLRRIVTVMIVNRTLLSCYVELQPFHPDRSNGFSPIGMHTIRMAPLVAVAGVWMFFMIGYPTFFHQSATLRIDTVSFLAGYAGAVPIVLVWPVWRTHVVMRRLRRASLETTARRLRDALLATDGDPALSLRSVISDSAETRTLTRGDMEDGMEWLRLLEQRYRSLEREQHEWPFRRLSVGRYILTTVLPLLLAGTSIYLQIRALPP